MTITHAEQMKVAAEAAQVVQKQKEKKLRREEDTQRSIKLKVAKKNAKQEAQTLFSQIKQKIEKNPIARELDQNYCYRSSDWSCDFSMTDEERFLGDALMAVAKLNGYKAECLISSGCSTFDKDYPDNCHVRHYVHITW